MENWYYSIQDVCDLKAAGARLRVFSVLYVTASNENIELFGKGTIVAELELKDGNTLKNLFINTMTCTVL